jgi:hypothetical protein
MTTAEAGQGFRKLILIPLTRYQQLIQKHQQQTNPSQQQQPNCDSKEQNHRIVRKTEQDVTPIDGKDSTVSSETPSNSTGDMVNRNGASGTLDKITNDISKTIQRTFPAGFSDRAKRLFLYFLNVRRDIFIIDQMGRFLINGILMEGSVLDYIFCFFFWRYANATRRLFVFQKGYC